MPFALILIGGVLFLAVMRGTTTQLKNLLLQDFTGSSNFIYWLVSIGVIGGVGYIPSLKKISDAFLLLVIVVFVIANKGFFNSFMQALQTIRTQQCPPSAGMFGNGGGSNSATQNASSASAAALAQGQNLIAAFSLTPNTATQINAGLGVGNQGGFESLQSGVGGLGNAASNIIPSFSSSVSAIP